MIGFSSRGCGLHHRSPFDSDVASMLIHLDSILLLLWAYSSPSGSFWVSLGVSGPLWPSLGLSGPFWVSLGLSGPLWASLGRVGPRLSSLGFSGLCWASRRSFIPAVISHQSGVHSPSWSSRQLSGFVPERCNRIHVSTPPSRLRREEAIYLAHCSTWWTSVNVLYKILRERSVIEAHDIFNDRRTT